MAPLSLLAGLWNRHNARFRNLVGHERLVDNKARKNGQRSWICDTSKKVVERGDAMVGAPALYLTAISACLAVDFVIWPST